VISRATKRRLAAVCALALSLGGGACGARPAVVNGPDPFPIVPLRLVIERGDSAAVVLSLDDKGLIHDSKSVVARLHDGRIDRPGGEARLTVAVDGNISFDGHDTTLRLTSKDDLVADNGRRISLGDDGRVVFTPPWKRSRGYSFRVDGLVPKAKKTALLVLLYVVLDRSPDDE
jgi:hypothetical protein